jgi:hypothetical protein
VGREARSDALSVAVVVFDGKVKLSDILAQLDKALGGVWSSSTWGDGSTVAPISGLLGKCLQGHTRAIVITFRS